ncbi:hypothetical protein BTO30_10930 [Domibacillus antri]|uniref:Uncharacterized protein n=1 Tax=Domibacillus antri TaxID=1714264 RepID=A0A1Q8Q4H7_9BACI|nr:hypothetical protein BTO30_10930 [Domibacillus antri]
MIYFNEGIGNRREWLKAYNHAYFVTIPINKPLPIETFVLIITNKECMFREALYMLAHDKRMFDEAYPEADLEESGISCWIDEAGDGNAD